MEDTTPTNIVESQPGSTSGESSSRHRTQNITRIDREFYKAAIEGNLSKFRDVENIECLLTPNKNTILHIHLTSTTSQTILFVPELLLGGVLDLLFEDLILMNKDLIAMKTEPNVSVLFVEKILEKCGGLALFPNAKGETPLHLAARYGHSTIVKLLLKHDKTLPADGIGAEEKLMRATTEETNDTALHEAVRHNHIEVVEILLEMDPELSNIANNANETPLYLASERDYTQIVLKILEKVQSPAYEGPNDRTALHASVINGDLGLVRDLVKNEHLRTALKQPDNEGMVPLHYAVEAKNELLTKFLLEQDENTAFMQDNEGRTALHIAAWGGHLSILEMIIKYYPDCSELVDNKGWNALHYAVNGDKYFAMERIMRNLSLSNLYNEKDENGDTPLHHLANSGIRSGTLVPHSRVDKLATNKKDQTALDIAYATTDDSDRLQRKLVVIRKLKKAGAKRSQRSNVESHTRSVVAFTKEAKDAHLIVATLIATVTFAAAFTLPGGTFQDGEFKGRPILGHKASFKAFILSDTIALVMSASAALVHLLSPLNRVKGVDHYLSNVTFSFILVAVAAMVVAFGTGTYAVFGSFSIGIAVITVGLSFFLIFRQVLRISFTTNPSVSFMANLVNVIMFPFVRFAPRPFGFYFFILRKQEVDEDKNTSIP